MNCAKFDNWNDNEDYKRYSYINSSFLDLTSKNILTSIVNSTLLRRNLSSRTDKFKEKRFKKDYLPLHFCKLQLFVKIFVPGQSFPFHFGAGLEHVRVRILCPPPHVTLHGCHDDHWLQLPFTDDKMVNSWYVSFRKRINWWL